MVQGNKKERRKEKLLIAHWRSVTSLLFVFRLAYLEFIISTSLLEKSSRGHMPCGLESLILRIKLEALPFIDATSFQRKRNGLKSSLLGLLEAI